MALVPVKRYRGSKAGKGFVNFVLRPNLSGYQIPIITTTRYVFVWAPVGLTRSDTSIIVPATLSTTAANQFDTTGNQTIDLREVSLNQHAAGMTSFTPLNFRNIGDNAVITGVEVLGQQADTMIWRAMKEGAGSWNDGAIGSGGTPTNASLVENSRLVKSFDAIRLNLASDNFLATVRGVYAEDIRDSFVQNPILRRLVIEDCLVDGCFQFLDMLPATAIFNTRVVVIRNCLIRLRRYPYDTGIAPDLDPPPEGSKFTAPWNSAASPGAVIAPSGTGAGYAHDWLFRFNRTGGGGGTPVGPTPANRPYPNSVSWQQITFPGGFRRTIDTSDQHLTSPYADGSMCDIACDRNTPPTTMEVVRMQPNGAFPAFTETRRNSWGDGLPHGNAGPAGDENLKAHAVLVLPNNQLVIYYYRLWAASGARRSAATISGDGGVTFPALVPATTFAFNLDAADAFQPRGIVQLGPGYGATGSPPTGAPHYMDRDYMYLVGNNQTQGAVIANQNRNGGIIYLCRYRIAGPGSSLTQASLNDRSRYSFFTGRDANGVPQWTANGGLKTAGTPIFRNILGGGADTAASNEGVSYFFQIAWHAALGQFIACYTPNATGIAIAHAPTLWDESAWQMLCYHAPIGGLSALERDMYLGASAPALWSSATRLGIGASTYVENAPTGGGGDGDNLILTQSSPLVAIAGTSDATTLTVDMQDCLVVCEGTPVDADADWPPGTYDNVKVLWTGPGPWFLQGRADTPPGVTIEQTQNLAEWTKERNFWLQAHGDQTGTGDHFPFQDRALVPGGGDVPLPTWPVSYTGQRYYVSAAAPAGNVLSTDSANPGSASTAVDSAPSLSTIVFMGAGPFTDPGSPTFTINRGVGIHLKLVSNVPVCTDLINLRPQNLDPSQLAGLENTCAVNLQLNTSARFRGLLVASGGYIWIEGFRGEFPDRWTVSSASGGGSQSSVAGIWFERCRRWQGGAVNFQLGPQANNNVNRINVVHKCISISIYEIGDPKDGGGLWDDVDSTSPPGSAVTDYGISCWQNSGPYYVLSCLLQMRANHMVSFKRGVGDNNLGRNRIEGNLFASWARSYQRQTTGFELGQEQDQGADYTSYATDVLNNTFMDPNGVSWSVKNVMDVRITGNRVISHAGLLHIGISGTNPGQEVGPNSPDTIYVGNNTIVERTTQVVFFTEGVPCTVTFENNRTPNVIAIDVRAAHVTYGGGWSGPTPAVTVVRVGGNASGFGAPT